MTFVPQKLNEMAAIFNPAITTNYQESVSNTSFITRFFQWCTAQNENRLLWLGVIIAAHGCVITPLTLMALFFAGNSLFLFMLAFIAMGMALVTNLAAMPTKYTLPFFALSVLIDLGVVVASIITVTV